MSAVLATLHKKNTTKYFWKYSSPLPFCGIVVAVPLLSKNSGSTADYLCIHNNYSNVADGSQVELYQVEKLGPELRIITTSYKVERPPVQVLKCLILYFNRILVSKAVEMNPVDDEEQDVTGRKNKPRGKVDPVTLWFS